GRARVPGPAAPPHVWRNGVNLRTHHIRFDFVALSGDPRAGVVDGIEQRQQLGCFIPIAKLGECLNRPDGGMSILPAILSDSRRIALDVTGVQRGSIEGRREEQSQSIVTQDEIFVDCCHGARDACRIRRAADHAPGLNNGVDAALAAQCRPKRSSIIKIATAIPVTIPTFALKGVAQRRRVPPPGCCAIVLTPLVSERNEIRNGGAKKPTQPYAFALPARADLV